MNAFKPANMVPIPEEFSYKFFLEGPDPSKSVNLTCLLPNGISIILKVSYNATLADIKEVSIKHGLGLSLLLN